MGLGATGSALGDGVTPVDDSTGAGSSTKISAGSSNSTDYVCLPGGRGSALYRKTSAGLVRWYEGGHPGCGLAGSTSNLKKDGRATICYTGMLVFRFYGTVADPAASVAVSRANQNWCANNVNVTYRNFRESPADSPTASGFYSKTTAPWLTSAGTIDQGSFIGNQALGPKYLSTGHTECVLTSSSASKTCTDPPTTTTYRLGSAGKSCQSQQTPSNPIKDYLANAKASPAQKQSLRVQLYKLWYRFRTQSRLGPSTASQILGLAKPLVRVPADTTEPLKDAHDAGGTSGQITFMTQACSSPMQFTSILGANPKTSDMRVHGVCYIPLQRAATEYSYLQRTVSKSYTRYVNAYGTIQRDQGERISLHYKGAAYTRGAKISDLVPSKWFPSSTRRTTVSLGVIGTWRTAMKKWYLDQVARQGYVDKHQVQTLPADAYIIRNGQLESNQDKVPALAAQQLSDYSKCRFGNMYSATTVGEALKGKSVQSVKIDVKNVSPFQVGGKYRPQTVRLDVDTTPSCYFFGANDQAVPCTLSNLSFAAVTKSPGPLAYPPSNYKTVSGWSYHKGVDRAWAESTMEFYQATNPGKPFRVEVSLQDAKVTYPVCAQQTLNLIISPPEEGMKGVDTSDVSTGMNCTDVTVNVPSDKFTLKGFPAPMSKAFSSTWFYDVPVISAHPRP